MTNTTQAPPERAAARPWWLAAMVIAIGGFWLYGASLLPQGATHAKVGPGMFVTLTGGGLVLLGLVLLVQIARGETFESQESEDADNSQPADWTAFATVLLGASIPMYTMERFGFIPSAALLFAFTARAFGSRRLAIDLAIGAGLAAVAWFFFDKLGVELGKAVTWPAKIVDFIPKFSLT